MKKSKNQKKLRKRVPKNFPVGDDGKSLLTYYHPREPMPPRFRTSFEIDYTGYLTASTASSFVTAAGLNKLYQPGTVSVTGSTVIGVSPWNLDASYSATTNPQGFSNIMYNASTTGGIYTYYKVRRARAELSVYPVALSDNLLASITAIVGNNTPTSFTAAQADRFTTTGVFSASQTYENKIVQDVKPWDVHGVSRRAWDEDESGVFGSMSATSAAPSQASSFVFWLLTSSASNLGNQCSYRIRIRYWVEVGGLVAIHETVS